MLAGRKRRLPFYTLRSNANASVTPDLVPLTHKISRSRAAARNSNRIEEIVLRRYRCSSSHPQRGHTHGDRGRGEAGKAWGKERREKPSPSSFPSLFFAAPRATQREKPRCSFLSPPDNTRGIRNESLRRLCFFIFKQSHKSLLVNPFQWQYLCLIKLDSAASPSRAATRSAHARATLIPPRAPALPLLLINCRLTEFQPLPNRESARKRRQRSINGKRAQHWIKRALLLIRRHS